MALLDLMGRRWTLRILWELRSGPMTSRELRTACDEASPTVMQKRLDELREAGFVDLAAGSGYSLTSLGTALIEAVRPLSSFADKWSRR
jgi:DNA-binding HxlR family transcriptional regulator